MADRGGPLGEFERGDFVFTVPPDGEVHRVEVCEGDSAATLVCQVFSYSYSEWSSNWLRDSWRPWIDQEARRIIAEAESEGDRTAVAADNQTS